MGRSGEKWDASRLLLDGTRSWAPLRDCCEGACEEEGTRATPGPHKAIGLALRSCQRHRSAYPAIPVGYLVFPDGRGNRILAGLCLGHALPARWLARPVAAVAPARSARTAPQTSMYALAGAALPRPVTMSCE